MISDDLTLNVGFENSKELTRLDVKQSHKPTHVLLALIKQTAQHSADLLSLRIFKPKDPEALAVVPQETLCERMVALGDLKDWCTQWEPNHSVGRIFSQGVARKYVSIIIRGWPSSNSVPLLPSSDLLSPLPYLNSRKQFLTMNRAKNPLSGGEPDDFRLRQRNIATTIFCGRPASKAQTLPPTLLHRVFSQFVEDCATYEPTVDDHNCLADLVHEMTDLFEVEGLRMSKFQEIMSVHGVDFDDPSIGKFTTNGSVRITVDGLDVHIAIVEGRNEVGSMGAEPFLQSTLYWIEALRILEAYPEKCRNTNHPCLLIVQFGPYIGVAGAVFADCPNVQMLAPLFPLNFHPTDTSMKMTGARLIGAIKNAIRSLEEYYRTEAFSPEPRQPQYPFPSSYTDLETSRQIKFIYASQHDEDKLIFFAETLEKEESICVKFVRQYSKEAHLAFADLGSAPKLRGFERLAGGWYLVAMDDVRDKYREFVYADCTDEFKAAVTSKVKAFHEKGYVHGDIRDVNLMVRNEDPTSFVLLDFDWAGEKGKVKYPMNVNRGPGLWRPDDAVDGKLIQEAHDIAMLEHIFKVSLYYKVKN